MPAPEVPQHLQRHARRGPRRHVAWRDQAGVGEAGLLGDRAAALEHRDVVAFGAELVGRRDADDARADDRDTHHRRTRATSADSTARPTSSTVSSCRARFHSIRPTGSSPGPWQGSESAQPSSRFTLAGLRSRRAFVAKKAASSATSGSSAGATQGHGRRQQGVVAAQGLLHAADPVAPRLQQVDVVGRAHRGAAPDPLRHAGVVAIAVRGEPAAMPGPGFGRREAAGGVDRRDLAELGQGDLVDARAGSTQGLQGALEGPGDRRLEIVEHQRRRDREAPVGHGAMGQRDGPGGEHFVQQHRVAHRPADGADRVERRRQRDRAVGGRQPRRVLESDQALQGGRDADRAAGVGAERSPGRAARDRHRATRGRAAGNACDRIERRGRRRSPGCRDAG